MLPSSWDFRADLEFQNLMVCFYLHPAFLISLCTLLCSLYCSCLWQWNFRQRRVSLQNTIFTHKTLLHSRKLVCLGGAKKCQDWKERTGVQIVLLFLWNYSKNNNNKSLKTHILKQNEVTDGQGSEQSRQSSLVTKAENPSTQLLRLHYKTCAFPPGVPRGHVP